MRIALLSKDRTVAALLSEVLHGLGHGCERHDDYAALHARPGPQGFDLVLIDGQDMIDWLAVLKNIRTRDERLPVMLLATRADEEGILAALEAGANDYVVKPLRRGELATRIKTLLRRTYPERRGEASISFGPYVFDSATRRAILDHKQIELTQKEFDLAMLFFRHLDRPLSRAYIQEAIWPGQQEAGRSVDTHVSRVRSKLGLRPENGFRLVPVYSFGYKLEKLGG